ncbi:MAG: transporter, partial [Halodesulfurarchaeum sp.]
IDFEIPTPEIAKQWLAAIIMAAVVYFGLFVENTYRLLGHNLATILILVTVGAGIYFLILLAISTEFCETVDRNLPITLPYISH